MPLNEDAVFGTQHLPLVTLLGMGEDGHFASIFPDVPERDILLDARSERLPGLGHHGKQSPSTIHTDHGEVRAGRGGRAAHFW